MTHMKQMIYKNSNNGLYYVSKFLSQVFDFASFVHTYSFLKYFVSFMILLNTSVKSIEITLNV